MKKYVISAIIAIFMFQVSISNAQIKYPVKSATVVYDFEMFGSTSEMTLYFNDYGSEQCTEAKMEMFGQSTHNKSIIKDKIMYSLDMMNKTYTKKQMTDEELTKAGNYFDEDNRDFEAEGIEKGGKEKFLGKNCQIYTMNKDGAEMKMWVWDNLLLKMESSAQGFSITLAAKEVKEGKVSKSIFKIPSDFELKEIMDEEIEPHDVD